MIKTIEREKRRERIRWWCAYESKKLSKGCTNIIFLKDNNIFTKTLLLSIDVFIIIINIK